MVLSVKILLVLFSSVTVIPLLRWSSNPTLTRRTYDLATISLIVLSRLRPHYDFCNFPDKPPLRRYRVLPRSSCSAAWRIPLVGIHTA